MRHKDAAEAAKNESERPRYPSRCQTVISRLLQFQIRFCRRPVEPFRVVSEAVKMSVRVAL